MTEKTLVCRVSLGKLSKSNADLGKLSGAGWKMVDKCVVFFLLKTIETLRFLESKSKKSKREEKKSKKRSKREKAARNADECKVVSLNRSKR